MDSSAMSWLAEMELDNSIFMDQCDFIDSLDEEVVAVIRQDLEKCLSSDGNSSPPEYYYSGSEPSPKIHKPNNSSKNRRPNNPDRTSNIPSAPRMLSFGNDDAQYSCTPDDIDQQQQIVKETKKKTGRARRPPSQTYDHIIAERKRREQLSQRFLLLTTMVPGLKKMDKTSVLGDTIEYMKQLQEREKILEEQVTQQTMESAVLVSKSQFDEHQSAGSTTTTVLHPLPEIEARLCTNNHLLIRVHCQKHKGVLVNLLSNVDKLNLIIVQTNVATFGSLALDITIMAQMEKEFKLTVKEIVRRLRAALQKGN